MELAKEAGAVIRYERMQGKGNVIRRMFREIDAHCYIMVDGDDTYPMEYAREMANKVLVHGGGGSPVYHLFHSKQKTLP